MNKKKISLNRLETIDQYVHGQHEKEVIEEVELRPLDDQVVPVNDQVMKELDALLKPTRLNLKHQVKLSLFSGEQIIGVPVKRDDKELVMDTFNKNLTLQLTDVRHLKVIGIK